MQNGPLFMDQYSFNISNPQSYKCANYFNVLKIPEHLNSGYMQCLWFPETLS